MSKWYNQKTKELFEVVLALNNADEAKKFFRDLLTENEIIEFGNRWQAAKMLAQKISYTKIEEETGLSTRTIARISKWLSSGMGGYKLMIKKVHHRSSSRKRLVSNSQ